MTSTTLIKTAVAGGAAVAGVALAKFALEGIDQFATLTSGVRAFQRVSGTTAEDASKLVFATKELGVAPDAAASAFGRLATRIGSGKIDLQQYGVEVAKNKDGTTDLAGTVANLSAAYQKTTDPTARAALANEAFGRSWQTLAPLLGKGAEDLKKIYDQAGKDHQIFSQADLDAGREYSLAVKQLGDAFAGLKVEIGQALIPVVTQATSGLTQGIQATDQATASLGGLGGIFKVVAGNVNVYGSAVAGVDAVTSLLEGHFADAGASALEAIPGIGGFAHAIFDGEEATNKFTEAQNKQKEAVRTAADLVAQGKEHTKAYKDAVDAAKTATGQLADIETHLADSMATTAEKTALATSAILTHASETLALEGSVAGVSSAMDKYNETLVGNLVGNVDAKTAADNLAQSHRDLVGATLGAIATAGKKAADDLGPNASAADKAAASTAAQRYELLLLEQRFPGLKDQIHDYVGYLDSIPPEKKTAVFVEGVDYASLVLRQLEEDLVRITQTPWFVNVAIAGNAAGPHTG